MKIVKPLNCLFAKIFSPVKGNALFFVMMYVLSCLAIDTIYYNNIVAIRCFAAFVCKIYQYYYISALYVDDVVRCVLAGDTHLR